MVSGCHHRQTKSKDKTVVASKMLPQVLMLLSWAAAPSTSKDRLMIQKLKVIVSHVRQFGVQGVLGAMENQKTVCCLHTFTFNLKNNKATLAGDCQPD